jgi:hypothetical protein
VLGLNASQLRAARQDLRSVLSEASFIVPEWFGASTWVQHAPFAFFLIEAAKPRIYVELGSHHGYSFFVVCQAVKAYQLATQCYAVDTWQGDEHAGFYDKAVFDAVDAHRAFHYADFAHLKRMIFDDALSHFEDGSIDVLHIDGRHFYEDVRHDFESWLPKMSESGIILLHDTQVRDKNFGVYRLWEEISSRYPTFEFHHGHGLGIAAVGQTIPDELNELFNTKQGSEAASLTRNAYERLGKSLEINAKRAKKARKEKARSPIMRFLLGFISR